MKLNISVIALYFIANWAAPTRAAATPPRSTAARDAPSGGALPGLDLASGDWGLTAGALPGGGPRTALDIGNQAAKHHSKGAAAALDYADKAPLKVAEGAARLSAEAVSEVAKSGDPRTPVGKAKAALGQTKAGTAAMDKVEADVGKAAASAASTVPEGLKEGDDARKALGQKRSAAAVDGAEANAAEEVAPTVAEGLEEEDDAWMPGRKGRMGANKVEVSALADDGGGRDGFGAEVGVGPLRGGIGPEPEDDSGVGAGVSVGGVKGGVKVGMGKWD